MTNYWRTIFVCGLVALGASAAGLVISITVLPPAEVDRPSIESEKGRETARQVAPAEGVPAARLGREFVEKTAVGTLEAIEARLREQVTAGATADQVAGLDPSLMELPVEEFTGSLSGADVAEAPDRIESDSLRLAETQRPPAKPAAGAVRDRLVENILIWDGGPSQDGAKATGAESHRASTQDETGVVDPAQARGVETATLPEAVGGNVAEDERSDQSYAQRAGVEVPAGSVADARRLTALFEPPTKLQSDPATEEALATVNLPTSAEPGFSAAEGLPELAKLGREPGAPSKPVGPFSGPAGPFDAGERAPRNKLVNAFSLPMVRVGESYETPKFSDLSWAESGVSNARLRASDPASPIVAWLPTPPDRRAGADAVPVVGSVIAAEPDTAISEQPDAASRLVEIPGVPPNVTFGQDEGISKLADTLVLPKELPEQDEVARAAFEQAIANTRNIPDTLAAPGDATPSVAGHTETPQVVEVVEAIIGPAASPPIRAPDRPELAVMPERRAQIAGPDTRSESLVTANVSSSSTEQPTTQAELAALRELVELQRRQIDIQRVDMAARDERIAALEDKTESMAAASQRPSPGGREDVRPAADASVAMPVPPPPPPLVIPRFIQGGGFRKYVDAKDLQRRLLDFGPAEIKAEVVDGRTSYFVRVGPIYDADYAETLLARAVDAGHQELSLILD